MSQLSQLLQQVRSELGSDFVATYIVGSDGLSIAETSIDPEFNSTAASAHFATVMKIANDISDTLQLGKMDDNLITTDKVYILTRILGDGTYYWGLVVQRSATLGAVRIVMNEFAPKLWDATPHG